MKKTYIQPETLVVRFQTEGMIAASLSINTEKEVDTETDQLSNKMGFDEFRNNGESYWD